MPDAINTLPVALRRIPMSNVNATSKTTPCFDSGQTQSNLTTVNVTQVAADRLGYGLAFNGSDSSIDVPADTAMFSKIVGGDFSVSMWVKVDTIGTEMVLFGATKDANNFVQMCILSTGTICMYHRYGGAKMTFQRTTAALEEKTWYHIMVVSDVSYALAGAWVATKIYVNGQEVNSENGMYYLSPDIHAGTVGKVTIGRSATKKISLKGSLALFRLYDRTLDAAQVRAIIVQDQTGLLANRALDDLPADGTLNVSGALVMADDLLGGCLKFDGTDDHANIALPSVLSNLATQEFTITLWVRGSDLSGKTAQTCVLDATKDANNFVQLYVPTAAGSKLEFVVKSASNQYRRRSDTLTQDKWYHIALVWVGSTSTARLYVDGVEATTAGSETSSKGADGCFNLARRSSGNGYFNGSLAHLRVYDRALPAEAILKICNQDLVATATFLTEYPLSFVLVDDNVPNALYISNDGISNKFTLDITNDSNQEISLKALTSVPNEAGPNAYHFELQFKAQTFEKGADTDLWKYLKPALTDPNWKASEAKDQSDGKISVYLRYAGANPLQLLPGHTCSFPFEYRSAGSSGGARGTTIQLRCANLYPGASQTPLGYSRIQAADIINRRGLRDVPLRVGIIGSNTILNDADPDNTTKGSVSDVTIRIAHCLEKDPANQEKDRLVFNRGPDATSNAVQPDRGTDKTQFTLLFEDPVGNDWDMASRAQLQVVALKVVENYLDYTTSTDGTLNSVEAAVTSTLQGTNVLFEFTPQRSSLRAGESIDLKLTNIKSHAASGLANLILKYEDLPGYQDGEFVVQVEKTPIVHRKGSDGIHKVGIGIAAPVQKLEVAGSIGIANDLIHNGDVDTKIGFPTNDAISMSTNGVERFRITSNGKVGIGTTTTTPATTLHIFGGTDVAAGTADSGTLTIGDAAGYHLALDNNEIMAKKNGTTAGTLYLQNDGGDVTIGKNNIMVASDVVHLVTNNTYRLSVLTDGKVGIGTTTPATTLHIFGGTDVAAGTANSGMLTLGDSKSYHLAFDNDEIMAKKNGTTAGTLYLQNDGGNLSVGNGNLYVVGTNGQVGIGTTNPTKGKLEVTGTVNYSYTSTYLTYGYVGPGSPTTTTTTTIAVAIWADGYVSAKGSYTQSDERIKDIRGRSDATSDLEILKQIEITEYTHKDRFADGGRPHKKVIGQQIAKIFPQAVSTHTDVIPDILQRAKLENGYLSLEGVSVAKGDKLRLIFPENNGAELLEVLESDAGRSKVATDRSGDVFVYGREVDDFHQVDYDALSMLNISAMQALVREVETLKRDNQYLRSVALEMRQDLDRVLTQINAKTRKS